MSENNLFHLNIQTPEGTFLDKEVYSITIKIERGYIGILKNRSPFISTIKPSQFEIKYTSTSSPDIAFISSGLIHVNKNKTMIICTKVILKNDVILEQMKEKLKDVEDTLLELEKNDVKNKTKIIEYKKLKEYYSIIVNN